MPIYEYRCSNGHQLEVFQAMSDDPVSVCRECGAPVERVFHPVAVHFKGSGFYTTDYARKEGAKASADGAGSDSKDPKGSADSKDSKGDKGSKDSKPAATSAKRDD
jgi:putative FmdB family regulatory protein